MRSRLNFLQRLRFAFTNSWDAAKVTPARSSRIPNTPVGAKHDLAAGQRRSMIAKAREFERNSPIVKAILYALKHYGTHTGINPMPSTSSTSFNKRALEAWNEWVNFADISSRLNFYKLQSIIDSRAFIDGDIFTLLVSGESGFPRIQLVESHKCQSALSSQNNNNEYDGVIIDGTGRPVQYRFFEDAELNMPTHDRDSRLIDANDLVLHYDPFRVGQLRGVTELHAVLDTIQDIQEIEGFEMTAVKDHSSLIKTIYNESGEDENDPTKEFFTDNDVEVQGDSDASARTETEWYAEKLGAETVHMRSKGDRLELHSSNRPSPAWQGFIKHEMRKAFVGSGLSMEICWEPSDQGGATMRFQVEKDDRFMNMRQNQRISEYQRIYNFVIGRHIDLGILGNAPRDWWKASWKRPRKASVDIGRDAKATVSLYRMGATTLEDHYGDEGEDWRKPLRQKAEEVAFAAKLAKELSTDGIEITRQEILSLDDNEISAKSGNKETNTGGKDEQE